MKCPSMGSSQKDKSFRYKKVQNIEWSHRTIVVFVFRHCNYFSTLDLFINYHTNEIEPVPLFRKLWRLSLKDSSITPITHNPGIYYDLVTTIQHDCLALYRIGEQRYSYLFYNCITVCP